MSLKVRKLVKKQIERKTIKLHRAQGSALCYFTIIEYCFLYSAKINSKNIYN